jgi:hypothetical protein
MFGNSLWYRTYISPASRVSQLETRNNIHFLVGPMPTNGGGAIALCLYLQSIMFGNSLFFVNDNYGVEFLVDVSEG